jgi:heme o synthase
VTVAAFAPTSGRASTERGDPRLSFHSPFARLGLATLAATFCVLVGSVLVAPVGSIVRCLGWPMVSSDPFLPTPIGWATLARGLLAVVAGVLALATLVQAWRTQRARPGMARGILPAALVMGVLLVIEVALGGLIAGGGSSYFLLISYVIAAAGEYSALVVLVMLAGLF